MVTHNPLYRSQRAELPHWALTLGSDVQAKIGIRMHDSRQGKPSLHQTGHALRRQSMPLAPPTQCAVPQPSNLVLKRCQFATIVGHPKVLIVSKQDRPQPLAHRRDGILQASPQVHFDRLQLGLHPFPQSLPKHDKLPFPGRVAHVQDPRKAKLSGLPSPRRCRFSAAYRPNSISRVLSSCSLRLNFSNRSRSSLQNRSASSRYWNPTTKSSAKRTTTTLPRAYFRLQRSAQRSNT